MQGLMGLRVDRLIPGFSLRGLNMLRGSRCGFE